MLPSVNILTFQLYTWSRLKKDKKEVNLESNKELALHNAVEFPPISLTDEDFVTFSRLAAEEIMRRSIKRDS